MKLENDLLAEVQRLRAKVDYLKKSTILGFGKRETLAKKRGQF